MQQLCGRSLRVDHVENYRLPKELQEKEEECVDITSPGAMYKGSTLANEYSLTKGVDLFAQPQDESTQTEKPKNRNESISDYNRQREKRQRKEERAEKRRKRQERREKREEEHRERRAKRIRRENRR